MAEHSSNYLHVLAVCTPRNFIATIFIQYPIHACHSLGAFAYGLISVILESELTLSCLCVFPSFNINRSCACRPLYHCQPYCARMVPHIHRCHQPPLFFAPPCHLQSKPHHYINILCSPACCPCRRCSGAYRLNSRAIGRGRPCQHRILRGGIGDCDFFLWPKC